MHAFQISGSDWWVVNLDDATPANTDWFAVLISITASSKLRMNEVNHGNGGGWVAIKTSWMVRLIYRRCHWLTQYVSVWLIKLLITPLVQSGGKIKLAGACLPRARVVLRPDPLPKAARARGQKQCRMARMPACLVTWWRGQDPTPVVFFLEFNRCRLWS